MIFKALVRNTPLLLIVLAILLLFIILPLFWFKVPDAQNLSLPLYVLEGFFQGSFIYLLLMGIVCHSFIVVLLYGISSELKLINYGISFIPLIYLAFLNIQKINLLFSPALFSLLMILIAIRKMLHFQVRHSIHAPILVSTVLMAFACLVFPPAVMFFIPSLLALFIFRSFSLREFLVFIVGLMLPMLYYFAILYIADGLQYLPRLNDWLYTSHPNLSTSLIQRAGLVLFSILSLVAILYTLSNSTKMIVRVRSFYKVWMFFSLTALSLYFFPQVSLNTTFLFALPFMTIVLCYYLTQLRKPWYFEIAILLVVVLLFISGLMV